MRTVQGLRRTLSYLLLGVLGVAVAQAGCGTTPGSEFIDDEQGPDGGEPGDLPPGFGKGDGGGGGGPGSNPDAAGVLDVTPTSAVVQVKIVNGVITAPSQSFVAAYDGEPVAATWLFDRGELGAIDTNGVFKASGKNVGEGIVTARYGAREGTAKITIVAEETQNGAAPGSNDVNPFGGYGGVGGDAIGGAVDAAIAAKLKTESNPASAANLGFLYPYDGTVWPRGLLPPLLMWETTKQASAVYVKLKQGNYTFEGTYKLDHLAGEARKRVRLEEGPWRTATGGNTGDALELEVKIYSPSDDKVYGPIKRSWKVAPGVLKGTVYYNSYDSKVTTKGGTETGGVIAIKPRSPEPVLAIPAQAGKCHVCHTVSADGSTLWAQDATGPKGTPTEYANGASYDLTTGGARTEYRALAPGGNLENDHKFTWSAPYPDGAFALASARFAREAYTRGDSKLFARANGAQLPATGLDPVKSAVTPAFSPDGRKVAFNFWTGTTTNGVSPGSGHSLAVFDFTCGAAPGSTTCAPNGPYAFNGLREIYKNQNTYPSWVSFLPDGKAVVFNNQVERGDCGPANPDPASTLNCHISTWFKAKSELWVAKDGATNDARRLDAANGVGYLPTNADHPDDSKLNYQPTVNPVASGGYYWVVFTSRRMYGNLLTGKPWGAIGDGGGPQKKLWVAAIDINNPGAGADPSHPAFYLPGQELEAGNARGFWAVDPCKANGTSCETGDECCNGFCRTDGASGALVCQDQPPGDQCSEEFEKCSIDADCCDPKFRCIAGKCARPDPIIK